MSSLGSTGVMLFDLHEQARTLQDRLHMESLETLARRAQEAA